MSKLGRKPKFDYENAKGLVFNSLKVLEVLPKQGHEYKFKCRCECGRITEVFARNVIRGLSKTCGTCHNIDYNSYIKSTLGTFKILEVICNKGDRTKFKCKCSCGNEKEVDAYKLIMGEISKCEKCNEIHYEFKGDKVIGTTKQGSSFIIDKEDYDLVSSYRWFCEPSRYFSANSKTENGVKGKKTYLHRLVMNVVNGDVIDHINLDKFDCRKSNLRRVSYIQNNVHKPKIKGRISKYKGVCYDKARGKWLASMTIEGKTMYLGRFTSEIEAAKTYNEAAKKVYGEFVILNDV